MDKKNKFLLIFFSFYFLGCNSNQQKNISNNNSPIYSQDTAVQPNQENNFDYPDEVNISGKIWRTHNLNVDTFQNGDRILEVSNADQWYNAGENRKPAYCYYNFDSTYGKLLGKLYNWYAVNDNRSLAPSGWHIPNSKEWLESFENYLDKEDEAEKIKYTYGWGSFQEDIPCQNCLNWNREYRSKMPCNTCKDTRVAGSKTTSFNGSNLTGFSAIPSGQLGRLIDEFSILDESWWWTSGSINLKEANAFGLAISSGGSFSINGSDSRPMHPISTFKRENFFKKCCVSIRCVKN